ncbi:MAG TPA: Gfo/Idh/MocA family oxidoreductase [Bacteroidales bacterium]|nr:Gfo/Idh/MocA family oxidoreductase [Bacteroidales bacterium]
MKTWNFGIIGAGLIADFHARAIESLPNASLIAICGTNAIKVRTLSDKYKCRAYTDYNELLDSPEIDIVTIATPSGAHMEPAINAAERGKHVLCEKPLEISLERIDRMIAAHQKAGTSLGGIFNYRFHDTVKYVKEAIDSGRFGKITCASVFVPWWRPESYYKESWHGTMKLDGGGALINQSIHMVDILQYLMGPVESLQAYTATLAHDIEAEDTAVSILRFRSGPLGIIYGTTASFPGQYRRLEITGTKGTIIQEENSFKVWHFEEQQEADKEILSRFGRIDGGGGVSDPAAIPFEPHAKNIAAFIDSIENRIQFEISGSEARKAVEIILAIYTSANQNKPFF